MNNQNVVAQLTELGGELRAAVLLDRPVIEELLGSEIGPLDIDGEKQQPLLNAGVELLTSWLRARGDHVAGSFNEAVADIAAGKRSGDAFHHCPKSLTPLGGPDPVEYVRKHLREPPYRLKAGPATCEAVVRAAKKVRAKVREDLSSVLEKAVELAERELLELP